MAIVSQHKVVASLPSPLEPDSIYYVRVGTGFDQYITNSTGIIAAYSPNVKLPTAEEITISDAGGYFDANNVEEALQHLAEGMTPAEIKSAYESNANTNAFTDAEKSKLDDIDNVNLIAGSNISLSGAYPNVTISSTNTTYSEIPESEVTAGTASTARAISARRLKFAVDTHGLKIGTTSTTAKAGNWTPAWGDVSGKPTTFTPSAHTHSLSEITDAGSVAALNTNGSTSNFLRGDGTWATPTNTTYSEITTAEIDAGTASTARAISGRRMKYALDKKSDTGHGHAISDVTGLQAAIDSKANTSTQVIAGTGLSGGGTLAANRTLSVNYGTTAGTAAQGNDSRINNGQTAFDWGNHATAGYVKTDTTYTAGAGLTLSGNTFSLPVTLSGSGTFVSSVTQTANGITVTLGTPPNTNTTYAEITTAEIDAGTASTLRTITGRRMKYALDMKADVSHTHTLSHITDAGTIAALNTNGSTANFLRGDGTWVTPPNTTYSEISEAEVTAGTASTARAISARRLKFAVDTHGLKIGTTSTTAKAGNWTPSAADIPNLDASKITSGTLADARIPNLSAGKITSGTIANARLSGVYDGITLKINGSNTVFTTPSSGSSNSSARTVYGLAEFRASAASTVGAIVFIAPNTTHTVMHEVEIAGLLYNNSIVRLTIQGYRSGASGNWTAMRKISTGTVDVPARWGLTPDGKACIILGDVDSTWSYPHFSIIRAMFSHSNVSDAYCSGWTTALVTDLTEYTRVTSFISDSAMVGSISGNAATATKLTTARTINGTSFNGTANITTANWGTARTLTIGATGKSVNGSANVSWSLSDIGAAAASHTHSMSDVSGLGNVAGISTNGSTANFLRGDGTWVTPPNTTYAEITTAEIDAGTASTARAISGRRMKYALDKKADVSHTHTLSQITDAGNVAGINTNGSTANYLRGDGTWVTPPNTTYSAMSVAEGTAGTATSSRTMRADYLKQIINNRIDSAKVANNADTTQGRIVTTGYLDLGNTDKQWWPKATSVFELLNGPDRTVWVEQGTLDAPAPDFVGYIKVERGPNLGAGYGFLRATGAFSTEEYIYSKTPLGVSGWRRNLIYEIGEWVDLRPYLISPYYFSSHREGGNYPPSVRLMPDGEVQMRGVVDFTTTSGVPNGPAFRVPEPFRPLMTGGGVCFADANPLWFGTSTWLVSGENNYSGMGGFAHGNVSIINTSMPVGTTTGSVEISGIRYFKY